MKPGETLLQQTLNTLARECVRPSETKARLLAELSDVTERGQGDDFIRLVSANRVMFLFSGILSAFAFPDETARIKPAIDKFIRENWHLRQMRDGMLRKLASITQSASMEYVVFKTINAAGTVGVDVDFMIDPTDFERCVGLLKANGFYPIDSLAKRYATGFMLKGNPIVLDLHTKLAVLDIGYMSSRALLDRKKGITIDGADGLGAIRLDGLDGPVEAVVRAAHAVIKESRITIADMYEVFLESRRAGEDVQGCVIENKLQSAWEVFREASSHILGTNYPHDRIQGGKSGLGRLARALSHQAYSRPALPVKIPSITSALALLDAAKVSNLGKRSSVHLVLSGSRGTRTSSGRRWFTVSGSENEQIPSRPTLFASGHHCLLVSGYAKALNLAVIVFFGPDGAGKSTQASLLIDYLTERNFRTRRAWIRAGHSFAFALGTMLVRLGYVRDPPVQSEQNLRQLSLKRLPALETLWPWVELVSVLPLILIRVKIPSALGRVVICERYTVDSVPSIAYVTGDKNFDKSLVARILVSMVSRRYLLINLDCDYSTLVRRRSRLAEPEEFIRIQREEYSRFRQRLPALHVDTGLNSPSETQALIRKYVEARYKSQ